MSASGQHDRGLQIDLAARLVDADIAVIGIGTRDVRPVLRGPTGKHQRRITAIVEVQQRYIAARLERAVADLTIAQL